MIIEMLKEDDDIPKDIIRDILNSGIPKEVLTKITDYAVEGRSATVLQKWLDVFNTSPEVWMKYRNRVYFHNKKVIIHKIEAG